jgi:hypothetical protein
MTSRKLSLIAWVISIAIIPMFTASAVQVIPASLRVTQSPGGTETYTLTVINNTTKLEEIRLYLGDWLRYPDGDHDWDIPPRGARWNLEGPIAAGEVTSILYQVRLPAEEPVEVTGWFRMREPGLADPITGPSTLTADMIETGLEAPAGDDPWIGRRILEIDPDGVATMQLDIHCPVECAGITIYEEFSRSVNIEGVDSAGGDLYTVNRSCIDWITLSNTELKLEPDESREASVEVAAPDSFSGEYWATIFVESQPQVTASGGVQISNIYRTAIKVYITAPATQNLAGKLTGIAVTNAEELQIQFSFANMGNVSLTPTGTAEIIDLSGTAVVTLPVGKFYVLPGSYAIATLTNEPLPAGTYQARVIIDYGGDSRVGGVRTFKVE